MNSAMHEPGRSSHGFGGSGNPLTFERLRQCLAGNLTLQELHAIHPDEMRAMTLYGEVLVETGRLDQARIIFEGLTALNPYIGHFYTMLGGIHLRVGRLEDALECYNHAIECNSADQTALAGRGEILLRKGRFQEGAADLARVIELDSGTDLETMHPATMRAMALGLLLDEALDESDS
ncbi:tetratricopeptide repeat protein [bacterium]|nr:tetratricopeptide repeat protein [candidate division CSSED10-310 bacterium]